jgi:hypothetical protein
MARRLNTVNFVYTTIGLGVAAGIGYYVFRALRNRRIAEEDNLMELRRSTRKAGRAVKDTAAQVGKSVKRGASDVGEAFEDASSSGKALLEQDATGYNRI